MKSSYRIGKSRSMTSDGTASSTFTIATYSPVQKLYGQYVTEKFAASTKKANRKSSMAGFSRVMNRADDNLRKF